MNIEPGIYRDVPAEDYHSWDAASNSRLCRVLKSPAHLAAAEDEPDEDTVEKLRGTAAHAAILEPAKFDAMYAGGPYVKLNTKEGKQAWSEFCAANPGVTCIRGEEWERVLGIRRAVWGHAKVRRLLEAVGETELSVVWRDNGTNLPCKSRLDRTVEGASVVLDLKTCRDARPEAFGKAIYDRGYFRQAAMYLHGLAAHGLAFEKFWIVAVESDPPHGVMLYEVDDEAVEQGWSDIRLALELYAECKRTGRWPGYPEEIQVIGLPAWRRERRLA